MPQTYRTILIMLFVVSLPRASRAQTVWHVDDDCTPPGTGTGADPYCTIQYGVDAAQGGDTVLVGPGTYSGDGNRDISMFGKAIILISSDGPSESVIDVQGSPSSIHRGFFLVHGETCLSVIDGFTITRGYLIGDTGGSGPLGGGGGAGIYIRDGSPTIRNCIIRDNIAETLGIPLLVDGRGAGIYIDGGSSTIIDKCFIVHNSSAKRGGGLMYIASNPQGGVVAQCVIGNNSASNGAGVYFAGGTTTLVESVVADNHAVFSGGGVHDEQSGTRVSNCIITGNLAGDSGHQLFVQASTLRIDHGLVQGGLGGVEGCCGWAVVWGPGNIDADPLFVDPENGDFQLQPGSPCIDAGNNLTASRYRAVDLDGRGRFADDSDTPDTGNPGFGLPIVDMGAHEFGPEDCNSNNIDDADDIAAGDSADCDENGVPDECQTDCNTNN
jgi:hypothetical protein